MSRKKKLLLVLLAIAGIVAAILEATVHDMKGAAKCSGTRARSHRRARVSEPISNRLLIWLMQREWFLRLLGYVDFGESR